MKVLVTGGAGYIGSHVVCHLAEAGIDTVVYDNLSTGHRWAVLSGRFVEGDLADHQRLEALFEAERFDAVLHFAAFIVAPESVAEPLKFFSNNTANSIHLLGQCARAGVKRFVFSSTAAVYGTPTQLPVPETAPLAPINPYGTSKMMTEQVLVDYAAASEFRHVSLRYFNVAGADAAGRIGQATPKATHLIKVACETVLGMHESVTIFGTDFPTPDGTGIRDYIHIDDLAAAHLAALDYLVSGKGSVVLNCGYGHGFSVRDVIEAVARVSGAPLRVDEGARRPGDPAELVAATERIREVLGWRPKHDDLDYIVRTALDWERRLQALRRSNSEADGAS